MGDELCKTDKGDPIVMNSRWQEDDKRFVRVVTVIGYDPIKDKVQIKWANPTWAKRSRFGKSGGYKVVPQ